MPTINISIQSSIDSFDHGNQIRKMNERHLNWKARSKTVFAEGMILYIEF